MREIREINPANCIACRKKRETRIVTLTIREKAYRTGLCTECRELMSSAEGWRTFIKRFMRSRRKRLREANAKKNIARQKRRKSEPTGLEGLRDHRLRTRGRPESEPDQPEDGRER